MSYSKSDQLKKEPILKKLCLSCKKKRDMKFFSSPRAQKCGDCKRRAMIIESKRKPSKLIKKCDALFSLYIRQRDGKCLYCGTTENLQCAHIFSRKHFNTRWDEENAITLCIKDHIYGIAHKEPYLFIKWLQNRFGQTYLDNLEEKARSTDSVDYEAVKEALENKLKGLK